VKVAVHSECFPVSTERQNNEGKPRHARIPQLLRTLVLMRASRIHSSKWIGPNGPYSGISTLESDGSILSHFAICIQKSTTMRFNSTSSRRQLRAPIAARQAKNKLSSTTRYFRAWKDRSGVFQELVGTEEWGKHCRNFRLPRLCRKIGRGMPTALREPRKKDSDKNTTYQGYRTRLCACFGKENAGSNGCRSRRIIGACGPRMQRGSSPPDGTGFYMPKEVQSTGLRVKKQEMKRKTELFLGWQSGPISAAAQETKASKRNHHKRCRHGVYVECLTVLGRTWISCQARETTRKNRIRPEVVEYQSGLDNLHGFQPPVI
jgi:hypothetical protein